MNAPSRVPDIAPSTVSTHGQAPVDAVPPPEAPPAPPKPPTSGSSIKEVDEELQHGFAANILAGGMFQAPPELARNILLGN
jgi:hypothetical protein